MSKAVDYWEIHDCRSLKDIQDCAIKSQFSCEHQPLLHIKLENVVLDELHLMLRITGDMQVFQISMDLRYKKIAVPCFGARELMTLKYRHDMLAFIK